MINRLHELISNCDALIIGAGAGLSAAAGFEYDGERFRENFWEFELKYKFHDMYSGGFYPYKTLEEKWAFWSKSIFLNRYTNPPKPLYDMLRKIVEGKNYFVITTNVDHCFQKAGFDKSRLFYTQGDYGLFQCSVPCHDKTYDNERIIREMISKQRDCKIPSDLIPICPRCGSPMETNLRSDNSFVEDEGWHRAARNYHDFLAANLQKPDAKILFLELGVGLNTPVIIKYPFQRMTSECESAFYVCVNAETCRIPKDIQERSLCIQSDLFDVINELSERAENSR